MTNFPKPKYYTETQIVAYIDVRGGAEVRTAETAKSAAEIYAMDYADDQTIEDRVKLIEQKDAAWANFADSSSPAMVAVQKAQSEYEAKYSTAYKTAMAYALPIFEEAFNG